MMFDGFDGIMRMIDRLNDVMRITNMDNYARLASELSSGVSFDVAVDSAVVRSAQTIIDSGVLDVSNEALESVLNYNWDVLGNIAQSIKTPEIIKLEDSLLSGNYGGIYDFANSLGNSHYIDGPNIAVLKKADVFMDIALPRGMKSVLKNINVATATQLSNTKGVAFDRENKEFYSTATPSDTATIEEANVLCSSLQLLSGISLDELVTFMNLLSEDPFSAKSDCTGEKINNIIANWDNFITFDREEFYHGRPLKDDQCSYPLSEMREAPHGVTWHGRYNRTGENHYYFCDRVKGVMQEIKKHSKDPYVQIARLKPCHNIRMIDLSQKLNTPNKFLEYCRFDPDYDEYKTIRREYLLPCYIASCCKGNNIEGIKYYGSKEYTNYVSWNSYYFDVIDSKVHKL